MGCCEASAVQHAVEHFPTRMQLGVTTTSRALAPPALRLMLQCLIFDWRLPASFIRFATLLAAVVAVGAIDFHSSPLAFAQTPAVLSLDTTSLSFGAV